MRQRERMEIFQADLEINSIIWYVLYLAKHFCVWFIGIFQMTLTIGRVWFSDVQFYAKHFSNICSRVFHIIVTHFEMRNLRLRSVQQTFWKFIGSCYLTPSKTHLSVDELNSRIILAWAIIISTKTHQLESESSKRKKYENSRKMRLFSLFSSAQFCRCARPTRSLLNQNTERVATRKFGAASSLSFYLDSFTRV